MTRFARLFAALAFLFSALLAGQVTVAQARQSAQAPVQSPVPSIEKDDPWIYRGTDIPHDPEWVFGTLKNGLRYAVRHNEVPPGQVSIRIIVDAGSLYESENERGYAHLLEHLLFRQSKYLGVAEAIPTWQRLGATFGSDTNAQTTATQTVYKLDLPNANATGLNESFRLLSGMVRDPVLSQTNIDTEVPIVLAEKRERGGAAKRVGDATRETFFAGQPLAVRAPIGTEKALKGATAKTVQAFHDRWYRPENVVIAVVGDADPMKLAAEIEQWFGDWQGEGPLAAAPDFGSPKAPAGVDPANPVGRANVVVEPDLPRNIGYVILRPYVQVVDNIEYNRGLMLDAIAQAIINRKLEERARAGGSYLFAQVNQDKISRSADGTFVNFTPLGSDWRAALADVRGVIADALANPPSQAEIDRELAEYDVAFASAVEERAVMAGSKLADDIASAVDIREAVATPETVLQVFRDMRARFTPEAIREHTRQLFSGTVIRAAMNTPVAGEADAESLRQALLKPADASGGSKGAVKSLTFGDLPSIGTPGTVEKSVPTGIMQIEWLQLSNGVRALIWPNNAEPGRVNVQVRFGSGYRGFTAADAPYIQLGQMALVGAGLGPLGQDGLDRISTGRKMGFDFQIEDAAFQFSAETRAADLEDQLYLFAAKLGMPRWDENPVLRARAAAQMQYESFATAPGGILQRDLDWLLSNRDARFATPDPEAMAKTTPQGFRKVWEPLLKQGPVEVIMFGDFKREDGIAALEKTFGALPAREPIPADAAARTVAFPDPVDAPTVLHHRGDPNQAAAVIAWPSGGGSAGLSESRQLEILVQLFNNRLFDAMREHAGASYAPQATSDWPVDMPGGGRIMAFAQLEPKAVPMFFAEAKRIASELAAAPPSTDELERITEPLRQKISRASTGNAFWMYQLEGASYDPVRAEKLRSLLSDYTETTPEKMQELARKYLTSRPGWRVAVIPEGQELATSAD
ncbi:peptidase M16 [Croceicoccus estronivorus]|uniref:M16 family metallopeptidase n=1 Tax=Croceicoccus estronivorus TaxID=1172626 RepID=UPI000831BD15|nr:M16 family metallopeptidase [Croceicoccus estronivorus]OCC22841.1 peptidase M16 [Croceicoccus estronivorus]